MWRPPHRSTNGSDAKSDVARTEANLERALDRVPYGSADSVLQAVAGSPVCQMAAGRAILCWQPAGSTDI